MACLIPTWNLLNRQLILRWLLVIVGQLLFALFSATPSFSGLVPGLEFTHAETSNEILTPKLVPVITFENEDLSFDFGETSSRTPLRKTIKFRNTGSAILEIKKITWDRDRG